MALDPNTITPVNLNTPGEGMVWRDASNPNSNVFYWSSGKLYELNLSALGGGNGASPQKGMDALKAQYGIDYNSIPTANYDIGDLQRAIAHQTDPLPLDPSTIKTALTKPAPASTTTTVNGPDVKANVQQQLAANQTYSAANPPTSSTPAPSGTSTLQSTVQPPTSNLQPGSSGDQVKQLQDWLVSQGYLTQDQVNTGYGTYGPQTTAAVAKWQTDHKVDNSSGPGYWGPKTIAVAQATPTTGGSQNGSTTGSNGTPATGLTFDPNYGVTQDQWNSMNDSQKAVIQAAYTAKQQAYQTDGQQLTFADALTQAAKDPTLVAQFSDAAKLDAQTFQQNLQQIQQASSTTAEQQQQQFENDRKALAEQQAAAGTAYSGFRGQAQKQLADQESGIVESSRRALQKQVNDLTGSFEQKYGTAATTPATAQFQDPFANSNISISGLSTPGMASIPSTLYGQSAGGITGSQPIAQQNAINSKAQDLYNLANVTPQLS